MTPYSPPGTTTTAPTATTPGPVVITARTAWREIGQEALGLLRSVGRLIARYWLLLLGIAALAATAQHWVLQLAVVASRSSAIGGMLVFALIPAVAFVAVVAMLTLMGRSPGASPRGGTSALAGVASALLVFLLLYEQNGQLSDDRSYYLYEATMEAIWSGFGEDEMGSSALDRIPDPVSLSVLTAIAVALVVRTVGSWVLAHRARAQAIAAGETSVTQSRGAAVGTGLLRLLVTYSELVWLVLSVLAIVGATSALGDWWSSRAFVHAVSEAWANLQWPAIAPFLGAAARLVGALLGMAVAGVFVPAAWLGLGLILFGRSRGSVEAITLEQSTAPHRAPHRFTDVGQVQRSWAALMRPSSRWGPIGGAAGLVLARGWLPVLTFGILFTAFTQIDYAVWWLADLVLPTVAAADWRALYPILDAFGDSFVLIISAVLVAAGTDRLLRALGMPGALRLPQTSKDQ